MFKVNRVDRIKIPLLPNKDDRDQIYDYSEMSSELSASEMLVNTHEFPEKLATPEAIADLAASASPKQ